ncbi:hypothetical protein [Providencia sneebia]|uniref:Nitrogen fixation protein NifS n=1 Tax=Providencia sneebia DSM 19967 TaxID=1141660 RepID=K8WEZ6_9GAMM|nr:hypothetical protein [Providencia sneebia]EKT58491.1 hypothetical protein OO7_07224 [Providencia sneebia DSM 19967]
MESKKKIYLLYKPGPTLGRGLFTEGDGSSFISRILHGNTVDNYLAALQEDIEQRNLDWQVYRDNTESDIHKLTIQNAKLLICIPGIKYQFNKHGFDKNNIIYLSAIEYASNETAPIIKRLMELDLLYPEK